MNIPAFIGISLAVKIRKPENNSGFDGTEVHFSPSCMSAVAGSPGEDARVSGRCSREEWCRVSVLKNMEGGHLGTPGAINVKKNGGKTAEKDSHLKHKQHVAGVTDPGYHRGRQ